MDLNRRLENFSRELVPSDDFIKVGNETADRIFQLLQTSKKYSVDRVKIAGSIGKSSAVCVDPDFDLVVFVNEQRPFFKDVLDNFEDLLTTADMDIKKITKTRFSVQFDVNNISFDLLPATNFVTECSKPGGSILAKRQADRALQYIKTDPKVGYRYGSAVCEQHVEFLKAQTPYVHDIVRLAKFWNKTLSIGSRISGRSTLIELIAIQAGRQLESSGQRSCLEGFKAFLKLVQNFDNLCIKFDHYYNERDIPIDAKEQLPLVLDPVNPYNNFAYFRPNDKAQILMNFKYFANQTLMRLNNFIDMTHLFEVQPKVFVPGPQPGQWTLSSSDLNLVNPKMEVRMSDKEFKMKEWGVKEVQQCLLTSLASLTLDGRSVDIQEVIERVSDCVDLNILGWSSPREWVSSTTLHESQDVTLWIPIPGKSSSCVVLSASW